MLSALISGVSGETLTSAEAAFLKSVRPCGVILFARNCRDHAQIRGLVDAVKDAIGTGRILVLIDQEGGRVQRLRPPLGRALPPARAYLGVCAGKIEEAASAARQVARLVAEDLRQLGINCNCAPVLDVPVPEGHDIIGDRAYSIEPGEVTALGRAVAKGFLAGGLLPVIKHIPGHGRATQDSHLALPVVTAPREVLAATDFAPFKALASLPAAMTAHVVFTAIDPDAPASTSLSVTRDVIRGEIGFDGLLMSDDLSMKALAGPMRARAEAVIAAGSDVALHCNGDLSEMEAAASGVPVLAGESLRRFDSLFSLLVKREAFDVAAAEASLAAVLSGHSRATESV
jgi:beta-N-acetylhexosaminidase